MMTTIKITPRPMLALGLVAAVATLGASAGASTEGIRGYWDPASRSFTPLSPPPVAKAAAPALTRVSGTFKIAVTVKIGPKIPSSVTLAAAVTISAQDPAKYNPALQYTINAGGNLARNGDAGTLRLTIPYIYELADPSAPVTFTLQVYEPSGGTKFTPTSTSLTTIALPKNGATTQITLGETI